MSIWKTQGPEPCLLRPLFTLLTHGPQKGQHIAAGKHSDHPGLGWAPHPASLGNRHRKCQSAVGSLVWKILKTTLKLSKITSKQRKPEERMSKQSHHGRHGGVTLVCDFIGPAAHEAQLPFASCPSLEDRSLHLHPCSFWADFSETPGPAFKDACTRTLAHCLAHRRDSTFKTKNRSTNLTKYLMVEGHSHRYGSSTDRLVSLNSCTK